MDKVYLLFFLQCLNLTQLLSYYGLSPDSLISPDEFTFLCPALLYQIDMRVCIHHYHQMEGGVKEAPLEHVNPGKKSQCPYLHARHFAHT